MSGLQYRAKYQACFEAADDPLRLLEDMRPRLRSRGAGRDRRLFLLRFVAASVLAKSVKTLNAVVVLCDQGWTADAVVLLRSLFEACVTVAFLCKHKIWGTYLYLEEDMRGCEKSAREMRELGKDAGSVVAGGSAVEQELEERTREARALLKAVYGGPPKAAAMLWTKKGRRRRWKDWTVRDRCEAVGLSSLYLALYRWASCEGRAGVESLRWHSKESASGPVFQAVPTDENLVLYLRASVVCFLGVLSGFDDAFKLGCKTRIRKAMSKEVRSFTGRGHP